MNRKARGTKRTRKVPESNDESEEDSDNEHEAHLSAVREDYDEHLGTPTQYPQLLSQNDSVQAPPKF